MFFTATERASRDAFFDRIRQTADSIVCISEFTRTEVVRRLHIQPDRVTAIPIAIHTGSVRRLTPCAPSETDSALPQLLTRSIPPTAGPTRIIECFS